MFTKIFRTRTQIRLLVVFIVSWVLPFVGIDYYLSEREKMALAEMFIVSDQVQTVVTFKRLVLFVLHASTLVGGCIMFFFDSRTWRYLIAASIFFHILFLADEVLYALSAEALILMLVSYFFSGALIFCSPLDVRSSSNEDLMS